MKVSEITRLLEQVAPLSLQESYDNAGLIIGNPETEVMGILVALDVTEEVIEEAIGLKANLIVAHHPLIFSGLKRLTGAGYVERIVIKAIQNHIAVYAAHTNLDSMLEQGVNSMICRKLNLEKTCILSPVSDQLNKLVVFVPTEFAEKVRQAMFDAGAGKIGNYDSCSYNLSGSGTFRAGEQTQPFVGEKGKLHEEPEVRIETIVPTHLTSKVVKAMLEVHPYEEPAYDIYALKNKWNQAGMGMVGTLPEPVDEMKFLHQIKETFQCGCIRYSPLRGKKISKIAVCGGSGSFLLKDAIREGADIFITGDFKYHQFFDADNRILIADIGHYESEQYTKELFYELLMGKFSNFAIHFTKVNTNPINYL